MKQYNCPDCKRPPTDSCYKCERVEQSHLSNRHNFTVPHNTYYESNPCTRCSNNPANGGSGICNCILNAPKIT